MNSNYKVFESKETLARFLAEYIKTLSQTKDKVYIALSGGNTPKAIFSLWSKEYAREIDWSSVYFFWVDERCVEPANKESNFGMTKEYLFDHVDSRSDNIFRVKGELAPEEALKEYISTIDETVPKNRELPNFDLLLLGMGDDGHTASIFPYQIDLWDSDTLCTLAKHPESGQIRISLTGTVINNSSQIFFVVTGKNKAEKVSEIILSKGNYQSYPASRVKHENTTWLIDREAAGLL